MAEAVDHADTGRRPIISSPVLAVLIFVCVEAMFFAGLISAYLVSRAGARDWPPPGQPRLPVEVTGGNTAVLLASGAAIARGIRLARSPSGRSRGELWWAAGVGLGVLFVLLQGVEWLRLVAHGLTLTSSHYGSFFYTIVGAHAVHAVGGLVALIRAGAGAGEGRLGPQALPAIGVYWAFVVVLWPILYTLVYLT